jgi:hypothetical protein
MIIVIDSGEEVESSQEHSIPLKDNRLAYLYTTVICLSTAYSGYSLTLIASSNLTMLKSYYSISLSDSSTQSLLNGILPAGGILGALLVPTLLSYTSKKYLYNNLYMRYTILHWALWLFVGLQSFQTF